MFDNLARAYTIQKLKRPEQVINIGPWPHGLNSLLPASYIQTTELAECVNLKVLTDGSLETRPCITKHTNSATTGSAPVKTFASVVIGSTSYELIVDENKVLYYLDASFDPQSIGTLESNEVEIVPYNGVAMLFDGSYVKYLDSVSSIKLAYDDGTGTSGYQWDNSSASNAGSIPLGNGTNTRIGQKFTTQTWDTGYTIPPTSLSITLSKTGTPNASAVTAKLRKVSDDSEIASVEIVSDATSLTTTATDYTASFTVTAEFALNTDYYLSIEHSGGDASNYVNVHYSSVASGGGSYTYAGSWSADTTKDLIGYVKPGKPPKVGFGVVKSRRLFTNDEDHPGYVLYSNLTHLDWSTPDGGGYIGVIDDDANSFEVGGIDKIYQDLVVYGKETLPYVCILTGSSPSDYVLPMMFQRLWTTHKTLTSVVSDLWSPSSDGISSLTGVKEYGDFRTAIVSEPIRDRIRDNWDSSTAIAGYYPRDGQLWLYMPSYHRVLVSRARTPVQDPSTGLPRYPWAEFELYRDVFTDSTRYTWTKSSSGTNEYYLSLYASNLELQSGDELGTEGPADGDTLGLEASDQDPDIPVKPDFVTLDDDVITEGTVGSLSDHQWDYGDNDSLGFNTIYVRDDSGNPNASGVDIRSIFAPQCFDTHSGTLFMGGSDGHVYKVDATAYVDLGLHFIKPRFSPAYMEFPFNHRNLTEFHLLASSKTGLSCDLYLYTEGSEANYADTWTIRFGISDALTLAEATMLLRDADFAISPGEATIPWADLNVNARKFQIKAKNIIISGSHAYINGFLVKYRELYL